MGQLNISHPDIQEFIHCKDNDDTLANFNISVQITDDFMRARGQPTRKWTFYNPRETGGGPRQRVCRARFGRATSGAKSANRRGRRATRAWYSWTACGTHSRILTDGADIQTSNPCGEEFLENYGNCCLGSINLDKHVSHGRIRLGQPWLHGAGRLCASLTM